MTESEIDKAFDRAIQSDSPYKVLADVTDIILDLREEVSWNATESTIVAIATFFRWMLDGGFQTYLRMPGSFTGELVYEWVKANNHLELAQGFERAFQVFPNTNFHDVEKRQKKQLTEIDIENLDRSDDSFFEQKNAICESVALFIRENRANLSRGEG